MSQRRAADFEPSPCPVCGNTECPLWATACDYEYRATGDEEFSYFRCGECGTIYIDPIPADRLATIYPSNYYSFVGRPSNPIHKLKMFLDRRFFRRVLKRIEGNDLSALDVGGGTGWLLDTLKQADSRVGATQVVDLDPKVREEAERRGHRYFCGRIEDFRTDERYHVILALNIIEHVADPLGMLRQLRDMLAPGGTIIIKTPNVDSLDARLFRSSYWGGLHCPRHWVLFNDRSLSEAVERSGLRVRKLSLTQGAPFWTWSTLIWLHRKGLVRIDRERPVMQHPAHDLLQALFAGVDFLRLPFSKPSQMFLVLEKR